MNTQFNVITNPKRRVALIDGDIILHRTLWNKESIEDWKRNWELAIHNAVCGTLADEYVVFMSGNSNFRETLYPQYKHSPSRDKARDKRSPLYGEAKRFAILNTPQAQCSIKCEADDDIATAWFQCEDLPIIASIDKDLLQCGGQHYNIVKNLTTNVSSEQAKYNFFMQMLTGDRIDNIPGVPKVGPKRAATVLNKGKDWLKLTEEAYEKAFGDEADAMFDLMGNLLWLRRVKNQTFSKDLLVDENF